MKKTALLVMVSILMMSCQSASIDKNDDEIKYKETKILSDVPKSTITFSEVTDSRCPEGVQCIWAGNAIVDLSLDGVNTEGKISKKIKMCLGDCNSLYPAEAFREIDSVEQEFAGQKYLFILEAVNPSPKVDSNKTKADYSILLKIEKR